MDFSISAASEDALVTVAPAALVVAATTDRITGVTTAAHIAPQLKLSDGTEWVYVRWGKWQKPTGQTTTDAMGNQVPVTANDGLFYALARWNGDPTHLPFRQAGWTVSIDKTTGVVTVSKSGVTMTSPPLAGLPLSF